MVYLQKRKFCFFQFFKRCYHFVLLFFAVLGACLAVGVSCLCKKAWTRGGRAKKDEFFLVKLFKGFLAIVLLVLMGALMLIASILSFAMKKLERCHWRAKKEGKKVKAFLVALVDFCLFPILKLFSGAYNLGCSVWDKFDEV